MKPLFVLISAFIVALLVLKLRTKSLDYQQAGRMAMASMLVFTAIGHFAFTQGMVAMIPSFIPFKIQTVIATGILEILFAVGLFIPSCRVWAGWLIIAFFVLMLPANIKASIEGINYQTGELNGPGLGYLWFRVPLQLLFMLWVYLSAIRLNES